MHKMLTGSLLQEPNHYFVKTIKNYYYYINNSLYFLFPSYISLTHLKRNLNVSADIYMFKSRSK